MPLTCPVPGCGVEITADGDSSGAVKAALLNIHFETVHKAAQKSRPPPLPLPKLAARVSAEQFEDFQKEWEGWCKASSVDDGNKMAYLLRRLAQTGHSGGQLKSVGEIGCRCPRELAIIRQHAVLKRAKSLLLAELLGLRQQGLPGQSERGGP